MPEKHGPDAIHSLLSEHRQRGEATILLNLCEHSFRSLFCQYTDLHRRLFVALVLDQVLLSCPESFLLLYSHCDSRPEGFAPDDVFQAYAVIWLHEHGHENFCLASSLAFPESSFVPMGDVLDLAITGHEAVVHAFTNFEHPILVLMGDRMSYQPLRSLRPLLAEVSLQHCRVVSALHAISSELTSSLSHDPHPADLRLGVEPAVSMDAPSAAIDQQDGRMQEFDIDDPNLESCLLALSEAHFQSLGRYPEWVDSDLSAIAFDGDPSFVPDMLSRDSLHDEDYVVFRGFDDPQSLILDVGANWGYSVSSIEASGAKSGIVSFEAIPMYRPCLAAVSELRSQPYHFFMTALSDEPGELIFTIPVVNNLALSALTTAAEHPHLPGIVSNVVNHIRQWMSDVEKFNYHLVSFRVPVQRLADVISANPNQFEGRRVVAIKIDVEGMEFPVLRGAEQVLLAHQPLIMAEGGASNDPLIQYLLGLGYLVAQREGSSLSIPSTIDPTRINGFFVHRNQLEAYRGQGILR